MLQNLSLKSPLISRLDNTANGALFKKITLVILGTLLLACAAKIYIPFMPVPASMESLAVLFIGMAYGSRLGTLTVMAYVAEGAFGLPVFSSINSGLPVILGSTGGYIFGFIPAAFVGGYLVERGFGRHIMTTAIAGLAATSIISICGLAYLSSFIGLKQALTIGFKPFVLIDLIKVAMVSVIIPMFWRNKKS